MSEYRQIYVRESGNVTVVRFKEHRILNEATIQELGEELFSLVDGGGDSGGCQALLLNFQDVAFLSSAALGKLIKLDKKVKDNGAKLKLTNVRPEIYEVFAITRLDRQFDIKRSEAEALASFNA